MKNLANLQNDLIDNIYDEKKSSILKSIKVGKISKKNLLDIYRNNLYTTLTNALKITYPEIYKFLKEKKFTKFCQEFIKENRSQSGNLDEYGEVFANFLAIKNENFLSDLARFEWFKHLSYLVKDTKKIDIKKLQKLDSKNLFDVKFKLSPSCFLLFSNYNILSAKKQNKPLKRISYFVVYRENLEVFAEKIFKNEFYFLKGVKENLSLYEIYEKYEVDIQKPLQKYLLNGVLMSFNLTK